jgi:hypothetical protein
MSVGTQAVAMTLTRVGRFGHKGLPAPFAIAFDADAFLAAEARQRAGRKMRAFLRGNGFGVIVVAMMAAILAAGLGRVEFHSLSAVQAPLDNSWTFSSVVSASGAAAELLPILRFHVVGVGLSIAEKQVVGANTERVVASMENPAANWNRSVVNLPRDAMSLLRFPDAKSIDANHSVWPFAFFVLSGPQPTRTDLRTMRRHSAVFVYLGPEPLFECLRRTG